MTPCEKLGYKVGQRFIAKGAPHFADGSIVELYRDDGTGLPCWKLIEGKCSFLNAGGNAGAFDSIGCFEPLDATMTIITRTNGQPFATEASARQQLSAKGLKGTHEVVPHGGGYALVPISRTSDPITLQPGDHVSTEGMTEDQYHAVARAFMAAGAKKGQRAPEWDQYPFLGWDARDRTLYAQADALPLCWTGRHLTIAQVLAATNANPQPEPTTTPSPITTLLAARKARDEAEQAYQAALEVVRNELPGYVLAEVGVDMAAGPDKTIIGGEDMTDPENWREGDVLIAEIDKLDIREGNFYTVRADSDGDLYFVDDAGDRRDNFCGLRFHHRPR